MDKKKKNERYHPDCINSTVKHGGGKLLVWGCMMANGVGTLKVEKGRLNASACVQLICHTLTLLFTATIVLFFFALYFLLLFLNKLIYYLNQNKIMVSLNFYKPRPQLIIRVFYLFIIY